MRIDKNNYEAFFLDYYEGTLTDTQVQELMAFLEQHPHLKVEFDSFENVSLHEFEEVISLENKEQLKKEEVNENNFDLFAIAYAEGRLSPAEQRSLFAFIEKNPAYSSQLELYRKTILPVENIIFDAKQNLKKSEDEIMPVMSDKAVLFISAVEGILTPEQQQQLDTLLLDETSRKEFDLHKKTKLQADASVIFPGKSSLKRKEPSRVLPLYYYWSAAASVAILIAAYFLLRQPSAISPGESLARISYEHPAVNFAHTKKTLPLNNDPSFVKKQQTFIVRSNNGHDPLHKKNDVIHPKGEKQEIIVQQPPGKKDSTQKDVIANNKTGYNNIVLVNSFNDSDEVPLKKKDDEYLTLGEALTYKVKNALLKDEMQDEYSYREDKKKFTWYDAVLVLTKGIRNLTGRDVEVKKKYNDDNRLVAYEFSAGRYSYTRPVRPNP